MKKSMNFWNIVLAAIALITLAIKIIEPNLELYNIKPEWITIVSTIILAVKQFIEQSGLLTPEEVAQFTNYRESKESMRNTVQGYATASEVNEWKLKR